LAGSAGRSYAAQVRRISTSLVVAFAVASVGVGSGASQPTDRRLCTPRVESIATPAVPAAILNSVAAAPGGDVWAVGETTTHPTLPVIIRRHRGRVTSMPSPSNVGLDAINELRAVVAPRDDEAWAVGSNLVLRWDGHRWRRYPAPHGSYWGISASGPDDVWVVGTGWVEDSLLVIHWNGTKWTRLPFLPIAAERTGTTPTRVTTLFGYLYGVLALAENDVWVVGEAGSTIAAHWDGSSWRSYAIPNGQFAHLHSLASLSPQDVWTTGAGGKTAEWSHGRWRVRSVTPHSAATIVVRRGELWGTTGLYNNVMSRWNGSTWAPLERAHRGIGLNGLAVDPNGDVWAVGIHVGNHVRHRSVMLHYRCPR
jgi:hypothetical protein